MADVKNYTAVEFIEHEVKEYLTLTLKPSEYALLISIINQAKQLERTQHGNTWDAAIQAHEDRGHVYSRSFCDFDNYQIK